MTKRLTFDEYTAERLAARGDRLTEGETLALGALGLSGEAGEFAELVKKHLFHGKPLDRERAISELGDVLWYLMYCADAVDSSLEEVAEKNCQKLRARYPNGFSVEAASKTTGDTEAASVEVP